VSRNLDAEVAFDIVKDAYLADMLPGSGKVFPYLEAVRAIRRQLRRDPEFAAAVIALDGTNDPKRAEWIRQLVGTRLEMSCEKQRGTSGTG
jgi:hypothetical protein